MVSLGKWIRVRMEAPVVPDQRWDRGNEKEEGRDQQWGYGCDRGMDGGWGEGKGQEEARGGKKG